MRASEDRWFCISCSGSFCCCLLREVLLYLFINFCKTFSLLINSWHALAAGSSKRRKAGHRLGRAAIDLGRSLRGSLAR